MTSFWQNDTIQWDRGIKQVDLIYAINDSGSGHITNYPALKDLTTPTRVRITMVQVSVGSKYDPSIIGLGSDAGRPLDAGDAGNAADAWTWDAGTSTGFAGSGGSAGAGGSTSGAGGMGGFLGTGGMATGGTGGAAGTATATTSTSAGTTTVGGAAGTTVTNPPNAKPPSGADAGCSCFIANHRREPGRGALAACFLLSLLGWLRRDRRRAH
jgi:hypothetical protein